MAETLTLQPDAASGLDTRLNSGAPNNNFGTTALNHVGKSTGIHRILIAFALAGLPAGATVTSANLTMTCTGEGAATDYAVGVHRALSQWYEGVKDNVSPDAGQNGSTWNHRNANGAVVWVGGAGGGAGSDYAAVATASALITGAGTFTWDVTPDVQAWAGGAANYGWWMINVDEGTGDTYKTFAMSDHGTAASRPKLEIKYTKYTLGQSDSGIVYLLRRHRW
jgi:hypothetical protein